eukprot:5867694-Prymnesium_polylepis.2
MNALNRTKPELNRRARTPIRDPRPVLVLGVLMRSGAIGDSGGMKWKICSRELDYLVRTRVASQEFTTCAWHIRGA